MVNPTTATAHRPLQFLFLLLLLHITSGQNSDAEPLLTFKSTADTSNKLTTWNSTTDPCSSSWYGVSCFGNRVSKLVLEDLSLTGSFHSLTSLSGLRVLSLSHNLLSGPIPDLSNLTSLKLLFLSHNSFSGDLPPSLSSLSRLFRLDLSFNNLSGHIPQTVNHLPHLLTLRLESNDFSGSISDLDLPSILDFNVSGNNLVGQIPRSLSSFPQSSFTRNPVLCGSPLTSCKAVSIDPTRPGSGSAASSSPVVVSSSPSSEFPPAPNKTGRNRHGTAKMSTVAIIALVIGDVLILGLISLLLYCYFWRNFTGKKTEPMEGEKEVYSNNTCPYPYPVTNPGGGQQNGLDRGRMVFFQGARKFELEDLLRASAEMLGKGGSGTTYKAVLDDGSVVAVKRLKLEAGGGGGKVKGEFEQQMDVLGRLRHPNVVALKAFYFARDEKLLVSGFMPNSSLSWLLHGNRGPGRTPLDWTTRLKIASGAAKGIAFIHSACKPLKLTHGNIKSTNVLIDKAGDACVSDFGLSSFVSPNSNASKTNGYHAPEVVDGKKMTQKADVYSFGVLLLELLTGKCPSMVEGNGAYGRGGMGGVVDLPRWVQSVVREEWTAEVFDLELMRYKDIEEEMVGLLQIAMACTSASADQRPKMPHVVKMIDEIRGGTEVSPSHDTTADSPSASEDTGGVSQ